MTTINWTRVDQDAHLGSASPSERQYRVRRIAAGWLPEVYRRFETPMSNNPKDPTPPNPEAAAEGWYSLAVGASPTVDEAMGECEENERRMEGLE